ncbi:MAG TPA: hypothetical protein VGG01_20825 [Xanthobacteraceae bacterium]
MIAELARENRDLRQVLTRLSAIVLRNACEQRQLASRQADARMTPVERIAKVRELSMQSGQLRGISLRLIQIGLACRDAEAADALKGLAGEFSDEAAQVDAVIATAHANE